MRCQLARSSSEHTTRCVPQRVVVSLAWSILILHAERLDRWPLANIHRQKNDNAGQDKQSQQCKKQTTKGVLLCMYDRLYYVLDRACKCTLPAFVDTLSAQVPNSQAADAYVRRCAIASAGQKIAVRQLFNRYKAIQLEQGIIMLPPKDPSKKRRNKCRTNQKIQKDLYQRRFQSLCCLQSHDWCSPIACLSCAGSKATDDLKCNCNKRVAS